MFSSLLLSYFVISEWCKLRDSIFVHVCRCVMWVKFSIEIFFHVTFDSPTHFSLPDKIWIWGIDATGQGAGWHVAVFHAAHHLHLKRHKSKLESLDLNGTSHRITHHHTWSYDDHTSSCHPVILDFKSLKSRINNKAWQSMTRHDKALFQSILVHKSKQSHPHSRHSRWPIVQVGIPFCTPEASIITSNQNISEQISTQNGHPSAWLQEDV